MPLTPLFTVLHIMNGMHRMFQNLREELLMAIIAVMEE
jgi:hypothetical protein